MRAFAIAAVAACVVLAGCVEDTPAITDPEPIESVDLGAVLAVPQAVLGDFKESVVDAAVSFTNDLYEPTLEVCADGSIYITGHTILVDTTGAPVFGSHDDGATWEQLPLAGPAALPTVHSATPPPSDEIFLSCGEDGWLYGVDITLATFPVNGWSGNGAELAYHNPNAYDEAQAPLQVVGGEGGVGGCVPAPAKDRPWGAYANGKLLMVSNPAAGPAQVGVLDVPPALPLSVGATVGGGSWNLCAGPGFTSGSCSIPGIPDIRADGLFAVPQLCEGELILVLGNAADVMQTTLTTVFETSTTGEITSVYGQAAFDNQGTLFVGISNNTDEDANGNSTGQMQFAASTDGGVSFRERTFVVGPKPLVHFYVDANKFGPGALVVWATEGDDAYDWFTGQVQLGADGAPILTEVQLAIDEGPQPSAHVTGAGVGPDGRAYLAMYVDAGTGGTPLSVFIQQGGVALPLAAPLPL